MRFPAVGIAVMLLSGPAWAGAADSQGSTITTTTVVTLAPLASPGPLVAKTSSTQVALSWTNVASESGYVVYRRPKGSASFSVIGKTGPDSPSYVDPSGVSSIYEYRVRAYRSSGGQLSYSQYSNGAYSAPSTSGTGSTTSPSTLGITAGPVVSNITANSATVGWSLSSAATGQVQYGITTGYGSATAPELSYNYSAHSQVLSGLVAATTYHYRVISKTAGGVQVTSPDQIFTTAPSQTSTTDPCP